MINSSAYNQNIDKQLRVTWPGSGDSLARV